MLCSKKHCPRTLPTLEQSRCHGGDFSHTPCGIWEKSGVDAQWQDMDDALLKLRRALKKTAAEGLGRNPTDKGRSGGKIHHVEDQGIPLGVTVTGANVHDSRLIGEALKNSREWATGFRELKFDTSIWTRGLIIHESARKSMLTDLKSISASGGGSP